MKRSKLFTTLSAGVLGGFLCMGSFMAYAIHDNGQYELDGDALGDYSGAMPYPDGPWDDADDIFDQAENSMPAPSGDLLFPAYVEDGGEGAQDLSAFSTGAKDDMPLSKGSCVFKNHLGPKFNLENGVSGVYIGEGTYVGDTMLMLAADRTGNNGSANWGAWLFQDEVSCTPVGQMDDEGNPGTGLWQGNRTDGDLLVVSEFVKGGTIAMIIVYRWIDPDGVPDGAGPGGDDEVLGKLAGDGVTPIPGEPFAIGADCTLGVNSDGTLTMGDTHHDIGLEELCATTNGARGDGETVTPQWRVDNMQTPTMLDPGKFFEAGLNLTDIFALAGTPELCISSGMIETRASFSTTARLHDYMPLDVNTCGSLTIVKDSKGFAGSFVIDVPTSLETDGTLELVTTAGNSFVASKTYTGLLPDVYNASEDVPLGWRLIDLECVDDSPMPVIDANSILNPLIGTYPIVGDGPSVTNVGSVAIGVDIGENLTCTFTNEPLAELTVNKSVVNACDVSDGGKFIMQIRDSMGNLIKAGTEGGDGASVNKDDLSPDDYIAREVAFMGTSLDNYDTTVNTDCTAVAMTSNHDADVSLSAGDSKTCTFTNVRRPTVKIVKRLLTDDPDVDFDLYVYDGVAKASIDENTTIADEKLAVRNGMNSPVTITTRIAATTTFGPVVLTETLGDGAGLLASEDLDAPISGYRTLWECDNDTSGSGRTIVINSLLSGEDLTCTFSNVEDIAGTSCDVQ